MILQFPADTIQSMSLKIDDLYPLDRINYFSKPDDINSRELKFSYTGPKITINLKEDVLKKRIQEYSRKKKITLEGGFLSRFSANTIIDLLPDKNYVDEEDYANLAHGSIRLINYVLFESSRNSRDVDTLVFLDQSARPGAFLFNKLWSELKKAEQLPKNIKKPEVIFLNYSDSERSGLSDLAIRLLTSRLKKSVGQNVVVIDESWGSGRSTKGGMNIIKQVQQPGGRVIGSLNFEEFPEWYTKEALFPALGLPIEVAEDIGRYLDYVPESDLEELIKIYHQGYKTFCNSPRTSSILGLKSNSDTIELNLDGQICTKRVVEVVYYYLKTAGGLVSLSAKEHSSFWQTTVHHREMILAHRELLAEVARFVAKHCQLQTDIKS